MSATPAQVWLVLAVLLGCSAAFSASETAFFSLSSEQRARARPAVRHLLERPRDLLVMLLLGNLFVNVLFFAFATQVRLEEVESGKLLAAFAALLAILLFGEILPKTLSLRAPLAVASAAALPLATLGALLSPVRRVLSGALELFHLALGDAGHKEPAITTEMLARVLAKSAAEGLLDDREAGILSEIMELGGMRVREIMTPRVDALLLDLAEDPAPVVQDALRRYCTWLPVVEGSKDRVIGHVSLRDVLVHPERPLRQLVMPVKFVPEVARVLDLLHEFRRDRTSEAVVIDEWGGTAGVVTIEHIFEEIVGDLRVEGEGRERPVVPLGEGRFRVAGNLSIRDWNDEFGVQVVPTEFETVGGFVTALLGRIPRAGDRVHAGEIVCEVSDVRGRRVQAVDMYVERDEEVAL